MPDFSQLLQEASTEAGPVDLLFFTLLAASTAIAVVIAGLIIYFCIKYRRRPDNLVAEQIEGSGRLEIAWAVVPLVLALGIFGWAAKLYFDLADPPRNALDIYVVGKQWMWEFQHADGAREVNVLHVPVGQPVRLTLTSQDVIHSFFVPAFRIKQDLLPRRYTTAWFTATQPGSFHLFCAEYCGTGHSEMVTAVIAMSPQAYQTWLRQGDAQDPLAAGADLFTRYGCSACHHPDNSGRGPSLAGVFGRPVLLQNGATVIADENYIRQSILDPASQVVLHYEPIMPSFAGQLSEDQLALLLIYLKSLSNGASGTTPLLAPTTTPPPTP
jgi:cytochrome c oxidase subunit 2